MQTNISKQFSNKPEVQQAESILRSCVHCGFCNATCPTYQLLGDELDGPRGRIYLIKQVLEGETASRKTQLHLDRCLTCRNCESTCPSGVHYSHLLNIGRSLVNDQVTRPPGQRLLHLALRKLFLSKQLFSVLLKTGQFFRPLLPKALRQSIPQKQPLLSFSKTPQKRKILLVAGCVQSDLKPNIDLAAKIVFNRLGIECLEQTAAGCCGSLSHHLNAESEAITIIKKNIDSWWSLIESKSIEAICMTASGCGVAIKEYAQLLAHDPSYADKAKTVSTFYKDPAEIIAGVSFGERKLYAQKLQAVEDISANKNMKIAFHPPCTLQHGMQQKNLIEPFLQQCGYNIQPFKDNHLCCGSAGTYSITQKSLSQQLLKNKLDNIEQASPEIIITANIGCQLHLQSGTHTPVKHWLELLA